MDTIPTIPSVTARSFETAVAMAVQHVETTGATTLLHFDGVAMEVEPGDTADMVAEQFLTTEQLVLERIARMPLLSGTERRVKAGDVVETLTDDHFTRIQQGTFGLVTEVLECEEGVQKITVRFARRTVDYEPVDFGTLRYAR